jgi:hypothetical protein
MAPMCLFVTVARYSANGRGEPDENPDALSALGLRRALVRMSAMAKDAAPMLS